jgi:hypothetical protein
MIIHSESWFDGFNIEVVNGNDIMLSYKNNSKVSSCMSNNDRWKRTKFYSYIPQAAMVRVMRDGVLFLRALLWKSTDIETGSTVKYLDNIYYRSYPYDYAPKDMQLPSNPEIYNRFLTVWQKFAHVRNSNKSLMVEVNVHRRKAYPCIDTFKYLSFNKDKLYNRFSKDVAYRVTNHTTGILY